MTLLAPARAAARTPRDVADALVRDGARLGEAGQWDDAIARFRAAEAAFPRALHDCNIGLAYVRSQRPHLGWTWLGRCQSRATEPLPAWVETRRREALATLRKGNFAPVDIVLTPSHATFAIDTLPDDVFATTASPGAAFATATLWLPFGTHTIDITADGFSSMRREIAVDAREALRVEVSLVPAPTVAMPPIPIGETPDTPFEPGLPASPDESGPLVRRLPDDDDGAPIGAWITFGSGLAALGAGTILYGVAADTSHEASQLEAGDAFDRKLAAFERERGFSYGLLGAGAIATGIGLAMLLVADDAETAVAPSGEPEVRSVHVRPLVGGGLVSMRGGF